MSFVKKGKKSRNELFLPALRYIVVDDWVDKIGHEALVAWLKLHSWVDRTDEHREYDRVPYTLESTWKKLGMGRKKFYEKILKPLWEYWLIDIVEYNESNRKTQKPKNIVVYESPMNKHETEIQSLKKLRDWKNDYNSPSKIFGRRGGQVAREKAQEKGSISNPLQMERVEKYPLQMERVTRSKWNGNNVSNNLLINTNNNNNKQASENKTVSASNNKQKDVVVVNEIKNKIKESFSQNVSMQAAKTLHLLLLKHDKKIDDVIDQTKTYFSQKGDSPRNITGALRYAIEYGWDVDIVDIKEQEDQQKKEEKKKYYDELRRKALIAAGIDPDVIGSDAQ